MPNWYCHNPHCPDYDLPQPIAGLAIRPPCRTCANDDHGMVMWKVGGSPDDPRGTGGRLGSKAKSRSGSKRQRGRGFYCQNPNQSGDTNGVGFALRMYPTRRLMFFINHDEVARALGFLRFYSDLEIGPERLLVLVCDRDASKRVKLPSKGQRAQLEKAMLIWEKFNPLGKTEPSTRKKKNLFGQRQKVMDNLLGPLLVSRHNALSRSIVSNKILAQTPELAELHSLSTVVPWTGDTMSGNQLYQVVSDPERLRWKQYDIARLLSIDSSDRCYNVGQSTLDVMAMTRELGTTAILHLRDAFLKKKYIKIDNFVDAFVRRVVKSPSRPVLLLVWIRGVSGAEQASLKNANITGDDIRENNRARIEQAKRNAHHVMTPQLFDTLTKIVNRLNEHNGRRYILCPIGDEIRLNQYHSNSRLILGERDDNLIRFFTRLKEFSYSISGRCFGPRRYLQSYFLHKLATHQLLGGVVQFGLRSGAMETLMYLGYPTIYLEEQFEQSGPRMAAITNQGWRQAATDIEFLKELDKIGNDKKRLDALRRQREASQIALMPSTLRSVFFKMRESGSVLVHAAKAIIAIHAQGLDNAPPYPFFFRLLTRNLIGLNPVGSGNVQRLAYRYGGTPQQARGTITEPEFEQLLCLISYCGESLDVYQHAINRGDKLKPGDFYLVEAFRRKRR